MPKLFLRLLLAFALLIGCAAGTIAAPPITAAVFTPAGTEVLLGSQAGVELHSWPDLKPIERLKVELPNIHDLSFSPNGEQLLIAGGSPGESGEVEVLRWPEKKRQQLVRMGDDVVYRTAWSADGDQWAAASADGICRVFRASDHQPASQFAGHSRAVLAIGFLPDGTSALSAGADHTLRLWEVNSGQEIRALDNHLGIINDLAIQPRPAPNTLPLVATVSEDRTVRLWQPTIGRMVRFAKLAVVPRAVSWSRDGQQLLVGGDDGQLRVIDPATAEVVKELPGINGRALVLLIDPGSERRVLLAGDGGAVSLKW
ncbi:WD40 repeat domain-containing protein [Anatilimnocola sp. NA78]|uniref:WD40 repeat domain-containing protein n=1 Tax=Anatilimnocola sp. NA78 TaxID=3415683 RepID=UPI003CE45583